MLGGDKMNVNDQTLREIKTLLFSISSINLRYTAPDGAVMLGPGSAACMVADAERLLESLKWSEMKQGALSL